MISADVKVAQGSNSSKGFSNVPKDDSVISSFEKPENL